MSWNTSVVTNAGVDLLNESLAGHTLTIESAVGGAGTSTEEELKSATDVAEPKQTLKLIGIDDFEQGKRVGIQITNKGVTESYVLHQIGAKYGKTAGQVALRYLTQNGIAVIPKSVHRDRMEQNLHSLDFTLEQEDLEQLSSLNEGRSLFGWY